MTAKLLCYQTRQLHVPYQIKQALLAFCQSKGTSIGDLEMQLEFMYKELSENYGTVLSELRSATSVLQASNAVLLKYERPADQSSAVQSRRASYGQVYYDKFASKTTQTESISMSMATHSWKVLWTKYVHCRNSRRNSISTNLTVLLHT